MTPLRAASLLLVLACSRTGVGTPEAPLDDAGVPPAQWVYENGCRAIADYFLVQETAEACVIAAFADRSPPADGESREERADLTRGPAPCPAPGEYVEGYPEQRTTIDLVVRSREDALEARIEGTFPDGSSVAIDFASADGRSCCECWGRSWPTRP